MPKKRHPGSRKLAKTLEVNTVAAIRPPKSVDWHDCPPSILVVQGSEVDLGRHVLCDRAITIGRDPDVDLSLNDGSISREHCAIRRDAETGRYLVVDLGSTNGTSINGTNVDRSAPLSEGDKVYLGASVIRFSFADEVDLEYQSRVEEMVTTDPLTGLATKRQYDADFATQSGRARKDGISLTVMVMDMDGLKQINDTYGHDMGGYAITEVASIMRSVLGNHGQLCRFGGDEFIGCFPHLERERAVRLAERLRRSVTEHRFERNGVTVAPTLSIGIATFPDDVPEPSDLFTAADRAMYKAKRGGRDRVATIDDSGPNPV